MKTDELREKYLTFFESKGCVRRPSDVLVPKDDPTVLFTPAGMNQFKNQFLGIGPIEFTRATTSQKCLRTGDISNVGVTAYHHTFFEMLGNFSFGDYFKREAIHWAWEFLTDKSWLGLDPTRLTVTVYLDDQEAYDIWNHEIKLPSNRISREDEGENFWPASSPSQGPDGVCGPCSEIYYLPPGGTKSVEIWNLVFTQFNRVGAPPNNLQPLPKKNIDTGMGLERCASTLQGVLSNFEIDILKPICQAAGEIVGVKYEYGAPAGRALRRIADHVRACSFALHEGCGPGPEKENYIVRLLLRRALMEGYLLGKQEPFLSQLVPVIGEMMKNPYPEFRQTIEAVQNGILEEEKQFLRVIESGIGRFRKLVDQAKRDGSPTISGDAAFDLHQTDGFLIELTESLASNDGLTVDMERFKECKEQHKQTSGRGAFANSVMSAGPLDTLRQSGGTQFLGYDASDATADVVGIIADGKLVNAFEQHDVQIAVVLNRSPFYGEAGGQVGDTGTITGHGLEFVVQDTQRDGELLVHIGVLKTGKLAVGAEVQAKIDLSRRAGIRRAHSATHILHHALRKYLGENATQRGSKVQEDELRFDFAHSSGLTHSEVVKIEDEINTRIAEGASISTRLMPIAEARTLGAMALFGEKYPDNVRVVSMGEFSRELCGGIHLANTGQVGLCRVVRDELVAAGVRRVTCLTGPKALERIRETEALVKEAAALVKGQPDELPRKIEALQAELREAKKQLAKHSMASLTEAAEQLVAKAETINGVKLVVHNATGYPRESLKEFADRIREKAPSVAVLLALVADDKVAFISSVSKDVLVSKGLNASDCVKTAAKVCGGGGGGRPDMAEAGGKDPSKIDAALEAGAAYCRQKLGA
ncbi:alanine--tRNA ligase [Schlesneria paludicola]|uniref:alanine--tRNA ligase n=1 Tax=Schlesneria paludicola TaxID=360056 RepID=UPI00029ADE23|nr:alanine--tRNA ligase [Schlesneria paludicola]